MNVDVILTNISNFVSEKFKVDYFYQNPILWGALLVALFLTWFLLYRLWRNFNLVATIRNEHKRKLKEAKTKDELFVDNIGEYAHKSIIYKLDRTLRIAGFRNISAYNFITIVSVLIFVSIVAGFVLNNPFLGIFTAGLIFTISKIIITVKASQLYLKIEEQTSIFVSLLCNNARGSSDIVLIMRRTLPHLSAPMYNYVYDFIINADKSGNTDEAFDIFKESIDNKQLRTILVNLKTCSHYEANYETVLSQMVGQITRELAYREERKSILVTGRVTTASLTVIATVILLFITKMLSVDITTIMFGTAVGSLLSLGLGFVYLYVLYNLFTIERN